jgi:hypothetical protein
VNFAVEDRLKELGIALESLSESVQHVFADGIVQLAKAAQNEWTRLAQERLKTSREIYVNGLRAAESFKITRSDSAGITAEIKLVGTMPNNLEFGMASFDMKAVRPGWLGGGKAKTTIARPATKTKAAVPSHKYIVIPFRHSKSDDSRFAYTGKAAAVGDLKTQLRAATKKYGLDRALTASAGEVATRRIPSKAPVHPYLAGLQKTEIATAGAGGKVRRSGQLHTFRIMSELSPAESWIHPGLKAANLLQEVETWVDKEMDHMMEKVLGV